MTTNRERVVTYLSIDTYAKVQKAMKDYHLSKSKTCALAIQLGLEAMAMTMNPDWQAYFEAMKKADSEKM